MDHIDEKLLEQYLLNQSLLSELERTNAEKHLRSCKACSKVLEFLREFYETLHSSEDSPRVEQFVSSLFAKSNIIHLKPFVDNAEPPSEAYTVLLAAMVNTGGSQKYKTISTLVSEFERTIVRIMHNDDEDVYRLYVLTEDSDLREKAIVALPEIHVEVVTNDRGSATFKGDFLDNSWTKVTCSLFRATSEYVLNDSELTSLKSGEHVPLWNIDLSLNGRTLFLKHAEETGQGWRRVAVVVDEGNIVFNRREQRVTIVELPDVPSSMTVRLYP